MLPSCKGIYDLLKYMYSEPLTRDMQLIQQLGKEHQESARGLNGEVVFSGSIHTLCIVTGNHALWINKINGFKQLGL
jgi:hypothetical protein